MVSHEKSGIRRKQIRYKYIQVTEAECYTTDMDKNIPTRIYTDRLSDINAIFAPS